MKFLCDKNICVGYKEEYVAAPGHKLRNTSTSCQLDTTLISEVLAWEEPHISYRKLKVGCGMTSAE